MVLHFEYPCTGVSVDVQADFGFVSGPCWGVSPTSPDKFVFDRDFDGKGSHHRFAFQGADAGLAFGVSLGQLNLLQTAFTGLVHGYFPAHPSLGADWIRFYLFSDRRGGRRRATGSAALLFHAGKRAMTVRRRFPALIEAGTYARPPSVVTRYAPRTSCAAPSPSGYTNHASISGQSRFAFRMSKGRARSRCPDPVVSSRSKLAADNGSSARSLS